jgi:TPR repeat protein
VTLPATRTLIVAGLLLSPLVAVGADYHDGLAAYRRGDYEAALAEWIPLAAQGDAQSQYRIARMYYHGEGAKDDAAAANWYRKAAEQGYDKAQNNLGLLYEEGRGVEQDFAAAAASYRRAAEQGLATAQANLGRLYDVGLGVDPNQTEAAKWYRRAAEQRNAKAQYRLGAMYEEGIGVPRDLSKAAKWYRRAAKQEHGPAERALGTMYNEGRGVGRDPKQAAKWLGRASARGLAVAEVAAPSEADETAASEALGASRSKRANGAISAEYPELRRLSLLAEQGAAPAQYRLAQMYSTGEGAPQSLKDAAKWYRAAAERGHEMAAYKLAFLYLRGRGVPHKDYVRAHQWFSVSAELGLGDARAWQEKVGDKMSDTEIAESESLVQAWRTKEQER